MTPHLTDLFIYLAWGRECELWGSTADLQVVTVSAAAIPNVISCEAGNARPQHPLLVWPFLFSTIIDQDHQQPRDFAASDSGSPLSSPSAVSRLRFPARVHLDENKFAVPQNALRATTLMTSCPLSPVRGVGQQAQRLKGTCLQWPELNPMRIEAVSYTHLTLPTN